MKKFTLCLLGMALPFYMTSQSLEIVGDAEINGRITNVSDPVNPQDAATKAYVDQINQLMMEAGLYGIVEDIDGNVYKTIKIDTQIWMAENLRVTRYNDGTAITNVTDNTTWANLNTPAYSWYSNDSTLYSKFLGALYNYYTVADTNSLNVCPNGWHIPTDQEWTDFTDILEANGYGFGFSGADIAKSLASKFGWSSSTGSGRVGDNQGTNNKSKFTIVPAGLRTSSVGNFSTIRFSGTLWSSTEESGSMSWVRDILYSNENMLRNKYDKSTGFSVRCLKD